MDGWMDGWMGGGSNRHEDWYGCTKCCNEQKEDVGRGGGSDEAVLSPDCLIYFYHSIELITCFTRMDLTLDFPFSIFHFSFFHFFRFFRFFHFFHFFHFFIFFIFFNRHSFQS